ncbi:putative 5-methyltetrahydropteroyltriglutamate-- homocysteine S-methyltransferase [Blattamonas nauphoetae]|uniref:5-methyltetrahydropteroyltriglutamate--homocysteine S-methyltransferase n=1 Tax=Blattamonas nauphoetae TaxID=2049346 RepID=A0ABQ9X681_9EUKA|nr:putative 5-methyltetrahydropteroyltriglutamate-- homocysteine S-methyltransferase [Blattamonas nauphoetae]
MSKINGPFRADHVGSYLRTQAIKDARIKKAAGEISAEQLKAIEDVEIADLVKKQAEAGLIAVTDGEFRRAWWHHDFLEGLNGVVSIKVEKGYKFHSCDAPPENIQVTGRVSYNPDHPFFAHFDYLKSVVPAGCVAKQTIPSPAMLVTAALPGPFPPADYKSADEYVEDVAKAYQQTIAEFYRRGCRYLQIDDTVWGAFAEGLLSDAPESVKADIVATAERVIKVTNLALSGRPADLLVTMHICKGNYKSDYCFAAAYDTVIDYIARLEVDAYFLEYDDERSGSFKALEAIAKADTAGKKRIVLGVFSSKIAKLEDEAAIKARIDDAAKYFPKERLCLSTQCGFASTEEGNCLTEDEQYAKLRYIVKIAKDVFGSL